MTNDDFQNAVVAYEETKVIEKKKVLVVKSLYLLYRITDARLIPWLIDIKQDIKNPKRRVYIFAYNPQIEQIIMDYVLERRDSAMAVPSDKSVKDKFIKVLAHLESIDDEEVRDVLSRFVFDEHVIPDAM